MLLGCSLTRSREHRKHATDRRPEVIAIRNASIARGGAHATLARRS